MHHENKFSIKATMMKKLLSILICLLSCSVFAMAQKSESQQRAEAEEANQKYITARFFYVNAFDDYAAKGQTRQGVECATKATALYYAENLYNEAFNLLRRADQAIMASTSESEASKSAMHYLTTRERYQMYMKMRRSANVQEQLNIMERYANASNDESLENDLLYNKAIYYYTFGMNDKGSVVFKEMMAKLTDDKDYEKIDEAYQTLIAAGRRSNNAAMVAQAYSNYIVWKDSVGAIKVAEQIDTLEQRIAANEAVILEKDSTLSSRQVLIGSLYVLVAIMAAALATGVFILLRYIVQTRKQKKTIQMANDNIALKAQFIGNISAQMAPTLQKLDDRQPEVKALKDFTDHIQTLSQLESTVGETVELEETQIQPFCESLMEQVRGKERSGVELTVNAPKLSVKIHKEYVSHILLHLLNNALEHVADGGHVRLEFKKRGAHTFQFLVSNTGTVIPKEQRDDLFKPFLEIKDLTAGDGLGLPICRQMALKMDGDICIDPEFTKGTRFVLNLHS